MAEFRWQKSFYDHIIRNDGSLKTIREYARNNPIGRRPDAGHDDNLCEF